MSGLPRMKPIVPWWQLAALLVICGAGVYFLLPDDSGLLDNLVRDRKTKEARSLFDKIPEAKRAADPVHFRQLELRILRQELPPNDRAALDAYWRRAIEAWSATQFAGPLFLEFQPLVPQLSDPAASWAPLAPHIARIPDKQRALLGESFVKAALGANQPVTAAEVFAATHPPATRSVADVLELARLWQLAGRAADALTALGDRTEPEVQTRRLALLRELNRSREALALLRARVEAAGNAAPDAALAEEFAEVALQAGEPATALPLYQRYVAANTGNLAALRRLRALFVATGQPASAVDVARRAVELSQRNREDVREYARILEWSSQPRESFDAWLELALAGDLPAVDRLVALNPGLYRDADLARALERVVPVPGHDDYTLLLARMLVQLGRYDTAQDHFTRYITTKPSDSAAMVELGHLHRELYRFAEAEKWLRRAAALRPEDLDLRREIAECLMYQGRNDEALTAYYELAGKSTDDEILGPMTRLAESLGRYGEFAKGLRRKIDTATTPIPRDYLLLAYAHELGSDQRSRRTVLEEGLKRFPESDDLRLQLALTFAAERQYQIAQVTLAAHRQLREDPIAAGLYLQMMRLNNDTTAERRFVREKLGPALLGDETVVEYLAHTHEALREYPEAERLFRRLHNQRPEDFARAADLARVLILTNRQRDAHALLLPYLTKPTPEVLKLAAEIASAAGNHRDAEKYQLAYLEAVRTAPAADWGGLGDIRLSRGDRTGAKRAYAEALRRMHAQLGQAPSKPANR